MGKKYLDTKGGTLESSILDVWKQAAIVTETNKNDKSDDGEGLDAVQPKAVKKKFANRKDKDIDNDGDTDSSDEYLHKRRKAVSKAVSNEDMSLAPKGKGKKGAKALYTDEQLAKIKGNTPADHGRRAAVEDDIERAEKKGDKKLAKKLKEMGGTYMSAARQLKDPKKEMMVSLKGKVKVIDKSDWPMFQKKGYVQAEQTEIDEYITKEGARKKVAGGDGRMNEGGKKEEVDVDLDEKLISARGKDIAQKMNKSKTMKAFAKKVAKMQTVTPDKLERMLPDYVAGKDIYSMFEEVDLDENAEEYTKTSYFTVQSMRERLHQVWGEAHVPGHDEDEDEKVKGPKAKTDTGKKAAKIDVKPEITEKKKKSIKSGYNY